MNNLKIVQTTKSNLVSHQGATANKNGKILEDLVEEELYKYGIKSLSYNGWLNGSVKMPATAKGILFKNVPYTNVYGANGRGEFLLFLKGLSDTRIECRSQTVAGSVDEKLPYLLENCKAFEEKNVIVVLEGDGYKKGAKEWFIETAHAVKFKNINVMSLKEFKDWAAGVFS